MRKKQVTKGTLKDATGVIRYTFLNNYMFISILERNLDVLKSLVCALLHIDNSDEVTIEVLNPITYGDSPESKTYILDIKLKLGDDSVLDIEMQVNNYGDYNYRATLYLCRAYDRLLKGEEYINSPKAVHIGFLDFDLFGGKDSEFYSRYLLKNVNTGYTFNDRFDMRIIRMNRWDRATEEDRKYDIDKWVKLFKAKTWEELSMAATTMDMKNAAQKLYDANRDEIEMYHAEAYEEFMREKERHLRLSENYQKAKEELAEKEKEIERLKALLKENKIEI